MPAAPSTTEGSAASVVAVAVIVVAVAVIVVAVVMTEGG